MDDIGTEPELLWPLLLVQIVYDELVQKKGKPADFGAVATAYTAHPLLPHNAPLLAKPADAEQLYTELLREHKVDSSLEPIVQAQVLAEPLYTKFHEHLISAMDGDVAEFERTYRRFEADRDVPRDERLTE